jgi:hypothetical protein
MAGRSPTSAPEGVLAMTIGSAMWIGYWLMAIGYWPLVIGYWLLAIGY